jgi:NADPH:quinone reductase-like Zn-dependent oxidoreductase
MSTQTTQAIRVHQYGGPEQLKLELVPRPEPQEGEVLVRVHAASVNQADWMMRQGLLKNIMPLQFPYIPGFELAGVVEEVGPGVTAFQRGQAVFGQHLKGTCVKYAVVSTETLALKPETLTFDEAATVPLAATTAWRGLFEHGGLQPGQRVLVQGAAGGVGAFVVQLARWKGAHVIGTTSTSNVDFVRSLGAETVIDYTSTSVDSAVHDVDLVFDTVGQETLPQSLRALKRGGILISIDALTSIRGQQPSQEQARKLGIRIASFSASTTSELLQTFAQLIDQGQIRAIVGATFPLSEAAQAHTLSQSRHGRGRIVLHID